MNLRRYYEILEVDPQTPPGALQDAYQDLLQAWDPGAFSANPVLKKKAEQKIAEIHDAYRKIILYSNSSETSGPGEHAGSEKKDSDVRPGHWGKVRASGLPIHPWLRFTARLLDYIIFYLILKWAGMFEVSILNNVPSFFYPVMATFFWIFPEGVLLHFYAATPGKWVFGIELIDRSFKKPSLQAAWLRGLSVWCNGLGTGFFLIAPATLLVSYIRLRRKRIAPWDRTGGFHMIHRKTESRKLLGAGFLAAAVFFLAFHFERIPDGSVPKTFDKSPNEEMNAAGRPRPPRRSVVNEKGSFDESRGQTPGESSLSRANASLLAGRYDEAIEIYRSIVKNDPNLAEARYGLGVSYAKKRRYHAAEKELEMAVRLVPEYAEAHHILGLIHVNSGNREGALDQVRILMQMDGELAEELNGYIRNMENFQEKEPTSLP